MKKTIPLLSLLGLSFLFLSCNFFSNTKTGVVFDREEFEKQKALYEKSPPETYSLKYSFERGDAFGPSRTKGNLERDKSSYTLTFDKIDDESITEDFYPQKGDKFYITSFEDMFRFIETCEAEEQAFFSRYPGNYIVNINVLYDETFHFPLTVSSETRNVRFGANEVGLTPIGISIIEYYVEF